MGKSAIWISLIAVLVSFTAGFLLANALNRTELTTLRSDNDRLKKESSDVKSGQAEPTLTDEEIRTKIAEADASPADFSFQKNLGIGLYRYGRMKENVAYIKESSRLLERANQINPKDYDVLVGLGHSYFDTGYYGKQNTGYEKAREVYARAIALKPGDVEVQTEIAMTYFLLDPPDNGKAIAEFQKSLQIDPGHEKTLQFLAQAYAKTNKIPEAEKTLGKLREVNPRNPEIEVITTLISNALGGQSK